MTHSYVWHDLFICVTWLIHMCDMTHSYVKHDSFCRCTWLIRPKEQRKSRLLYMSRTPPWNFGNSFIFMTRLICRRTWLMRARVTEKMCACVCVCVCVCVRVCVWYHVTFWREFETEWIHVCVSVCVYVCVSNITLHSGGNLRSRQWESTWKCCEDVLRWSVELMMCGGAPMKCCDDVYRGTHEVLRWCVQGHHQYKRHDTRDQWRIDVIREWYSRIEILTRMTESCHTCTSHIVSYVSIYTVTIHKHTYTL